MKAEKIFDFVVTKKKKCVIIRKTWFRKGISMKKITIICCLLACVFCVSGCTKKSDSTKSAEVSTVQTVDIDLLATNMVGYDWFLYDTDSKIASLKNNRSVYLQADGVGRKEDIYRFTMQSVAPGTATVEFRYAKGENNLENSIGKAVYTVTVDESRTITASQDIFEDPRGFVFVENIGNIAMENLNLRCIDISLPDNEQDSDSWYFTVQKEGAAKIAKEMFTADPNGQWGTKEFYVEATKKGKCTVTFYYIPDAAINGTMKVPTTQTVDENGETIEVPVAENVIKYACENATYRAIYMLETDKELKETITQKEEYLPDVSVPVALSAETVFARSGLDTSDPDLKYQAPVN